MDKTYYYVGEDPREALTKVQTIYERNVHASPKLAISFVKNPKDGLVSIGGADVETLKSELSFSDSCWTETDPEKV